MRLFSSIPTAAIFVALVGASVRRLRDPRPRRIDGFAELIRRTRTQL